MQQPLPVLHSNREKCLFCNRKIGWKEFRLELFKTDVSHFRLKNTSSGCVYHSFIHSYSHVTSWTGRRFIAGPHRNALTLTPTANLEFPHMSWTAGGSRSSLENPRRDMEKIQAPHRKAPPPCVPIKPSTTFLTVPLLKVYDKGF